jgi:hypothetical protein
MINPIVLKGTSGTINGNNMIDPVVQLQEINAKLDLLSSQ